MDTTSKREFFISYNLNDEAFAEWIAGVLEDEGYTTVIRAWDSRPGGNFVLDMQDAINNTKHTIAVLSPAYLRSEFAQAEWAARFVQDPASKRRMLIPVRVEACELTGLLRPLVCVELVGLGEAKAREILLSALAEERSKPDRPIDFPVLRIPHNLPRTSELFVGREGALVDLHLRLQPDIPMAISSIKGMGGIGKTELALQYARKHLIAEGYAGGVCWLNAREELGTQIVSFARSRLQLQIPEDVELAEQVRLCWRWWQNSQTLVVFDDVQAYADIKPFLPPQDAQFRVLLTTRKYLDASVQAYEIAVLSEEASLELLRSLVSDGRVDQDLTTAKQVCEWLGYLPLGLELVGRYLARKKGLSITTLWDRLQEKKLAAKALIEAESGMTASLGITAAFELSWQELTSEAQRLAAVLSLFALAEIPWSLVQQCLLEIDEEDLEDLRDEQLVNLSLLSFESEEVYQLHQVLREFFAVKRLQRTDVAELEHKYSEVIIAEARRVKEQSGQLFITESTLMIAHLQAAVEFLVKPEQTIDSAACLFWIATIYCEQGRYTQAASMSEQCLSIREKILGQDHLDVAESLSILATIYERQGRYEEAESLYLRALEILQQKVGTTHPDTGRSFNNLAGLYWSKGRYEEAESLYLRALEIEEQQLGITHRDTLTSLGSLAGLYYIQGRYEEAELHYSRVLEIQKQQEKTHHLALTLNSLALVYYSQGRYEEAEPLHLQAIEIYQQRYGDNHSDVANGLASLAVLYDAQQRYKDAERLYLKALEIRKNHLGDEHPSTAKSRTNLAESYRKQKRYEEAEPLLLQSLEIQEQLLGTDHAEVATTLNNLALLYESQKRFDDAEPLFLRALSILRQQLDAEHPYVAASLNNLALVYCSQERYAEAEQLHLESLKIAVGKLGEIHPWTQIFQEKFRLLLQKAIQENRTDELSNNPMTQSLLQQLQNEES